MSEDIEITIDGQRLSAVQAGVLKVAIEGFLRQTGDREYLRDAGRDVLDRREAAAEVLAMLALPIIGSSGPTGR